MVRDLPLVSVQEAAAQVDRLLPEGVDYLINVAGAALQYCSSLKLSYVCALYCARLLGGCLFISRALQ